MKDEGNQKLLGQCKYQLKWTIVQNLHSKNFRNLLDSKPTIYQVRRPSRVARLWFIYFMNLSGYKLALNRLDKVLSMKSRGNQWPWTSKEPTCRWLDMQVKSSHADSREHIAMYVIHQQSSSCKSKCSHWELRFFFFFVLTNEGISGQKHMTKNAQLYFIQ